MGEYEVEVYEIRYIPGEYDKLTHIFKESYIKNLRKRFKKDGVGLAYKITADLVKQMFMASVIVFINRDGSIKIKDDRNNKIVEHSANAVVWLGDSIIDLLHSDRIIPISEYIKSLRDINKGIIELDALLSTAYSDIGKEITPTLDWLENYRSMGDN